MNERAPDIVHLDRLVNHVFTYQYAQPDEYHYCQDSVIVPMFVADRVRSRMEASHAPVTALDVCAGCGIMGLELAHYLPSIQQFDFIEIQEIFLDPFERNLQITGRSPKDFRFLQMNYEALKTADFERRYDLIVANPPYFFPNEGKLSPSMIKNRCRFFIDSDLRTLIEGICQALKPGGEGYVLLKNGSRHGRDSLRNLRTWLTPDVEAEVVADIRGTDLVQLRREAL